jgi:carboxypeptidase C (cathepsin A)
LITPPKDELGAILEERDIKVLIMNGDLDFHTNYFGTEKLVENLEWYGKEDFNNYNHGNLKRWHFTNTTSGDDHVPGGDMRVHDRLTYLRIHETGIYVYNERPELMTDLLK